MHPRTPLLAAAAIAVAAAAAPATAVAAPWSAPVTISSPHTFLYPLGAAPAKMSTIAWWGWQDGLGPTGGAAFAVRPSGASAFAPERPIARLPVVLDVQGHGDDRLVALSQEFVPGARSSVDAIQAVRVADGGPAGMRAPVTLARAAVNGQARLAVAPSGHGLVAFGTSEPRTNRVLIRVAVRSPSGRFSRPEVISGRGQSDAVAVAAGCRGDLVVAFARNKRVVVRVRRPGRGWGRVQTLARPHGTTQWSLRAAIGDKGDALVLWRERRLNQPARPSTRALQFSRLSATGSRFSAARTIEADRANTLSQLVAVPGGFAVGYTLRENVPGAPSIPRVALVTGDAPARLDVAAASGGVRDVRLAWSPRLGLLATMVLPTPTGNGDGIGLGAVLARGAAAFGPVETVTPDENVHELAPSVDGDGTPVAVWSARPEGTGPGIPIEDLRSVVRAAARTG